MTSSRYVYPVRSDSAIHSASHHTGNSNTCGCCRISGDLDEDRRYVENESRCPQFPTNSISLAASRRYVPVNLSSAWLTSSRRYSLLSVSAVIIYTEQYWRPLIQHASTLLCFNTIALVLDIVPNASINLSSTEFILVTDACVHQFMIRTFVDFTGSASQAVLSAASSSTSEAYIHETPPVNARIRCPA